MSEFATSAEVLAKLEAGLRERVADDTRMQCRICWHVYDPREGCPDSQTPAGTPFKALPDWWTCPGCGNGKDVFMPIDDAFVDGSGE